MRFHKYAYIVLALLTVVFLAMTIYATVSGNTDIFYTKTNISFFALFFFIQVICVSIFKPKLNVYRVGFYIMHIGLLIMLVGFFAYYVSGESIYANVPVDETKAYTEIEKIDDNGKSRLVDLGFAITLVDFHIDYYEKEEGQEAAQPKQYIAFLKFTDPTSLKAKRTEISVNSPVRHNGWKIYLMSYNGTGESVLLLFKKDPAEFVTLSGIYMTMIGGVLMCLIRKRKAGDES